ncbi:PAQR family membrane homeostasis protein TrhA [Brachybacterium sp.]|uniref:PAQR family membrane homeostasis protein TrhA n=1 Tax=Brachybacterium sp. TaxID=1891286 RepID=UPI002ED400F1
MDNGPRRDGERPSAAHRPDDASRHGAAPMHQDSSAREDAEAVADSGGTELPADQTRSADGALLADEMLPADEELPTAATHPFAPRTLTRTMARRALQLGLELPKPRLRGVLHLIAFPTSLVVGLLLVAVGETLPVRLACAVFVLTAGLLFGVSAVYHRGTWTPRRAIMLRRFDHSNIFLIIAGTYTPLAITLLETRQAATLLAIAWGGALIGVCFRLFWTGAPRWIYVPAYIALGWVAVFYMPEMQAGGGWAVVWLLIIGGLAYTAGAVMYALKRPNPSPAWFGFHEIFHAGTLIGFGCHFAAVAVAVL